MNPLHASCATDAVHACVAKLSRSDSDMLTPAFVVVVVVLTVVAAVPPRVTGKASSGWLCRAAVVGVVANHPTLQGGAVSCSSYEKGPVRHVRTANQPSCTGDP